MYTFIDKEGTFVVKNPARFPVYFPLTNQDGTLLSSISPRLAGDIKKDNDHFLTPPASIEDLHSNLLCRREFFIKVGGRIVRASSDSTSLKLEAGLLYHKLTKTAGPLKIEILNFIPHDLAVEVMQVKVENISGRTVEIIPTSFIPLFGRSEKNTRDHRHVSSLLNRISLNRFGILLKPTMIFDEKGHSGNDTIYFVQGFQGNGVAPLGQYPTLDCFYGEGDAVKPDAIYKDILPELENKAEFNGKEACAALRFSSLRLPPGKTVEYSLIMGVASGEHEISAAFSRLSSVSKIKESLQRTRSYWLRYLSSLEFNFNNPRFDNWLLWVRLQPTLRKLFGCSFLPHFDYGKGGRGWRDLWQDALALVLTEPEKAALLIVNSFKGVRIDGSNATIITKEGQFISDRNRISRVWMDHGVWPYLTLRLYLHKTGDFGLLYKKIPYFRDQLLKRAKEIDTGFSQKEYILRTKKKAIYQGSLLEHLLVQNVVPFFNVGKHNSIRLENADWNDGLDMATSQGESVAFSFMYAHNLKDICTILSVLKEKNPRVTVLKELLLLLDRIGTPVDYTRAEAKIGRLERYFQETKHIQGTTVSIPVDKLIEDLQAKAAYLFDLLRKKEWLKEGFFNGYYDNNARRVEGKKNAGIIMMLQSQVFPIMSGGATEAQITHIWQSINAYLKDVAAGGFRLNTDFGRIRLDFGRAFGFAYGEKENGAFFNHMVVMLGNALYKRGFIEEGFEALNSVYAMAIKDQARIYPMIPEYFNSQGRGLYHYLTGSASWYIFTLLEEVLGISFIRGDIRIQPKLLPQNFCSPRIEVTFSFAGKRVRVVFLAPGLRNSGGAYTVHKVMVNDCRLNIGPDEYIIPRGLLDRKYNEVVVHLDGMRAGGNR